MHLRLLILTVVLCVSASLSISAATNDGSVAAIASGLVDERRAQQRAAFEALARSAQPRAAIILAALQEGVLYKRRADSRLVIAAREGRNYALTDAQTGEPLASASRREVRRISINNRLRADIKRWRAEALLHSPDPELRLAAVHEFTAELDPLVRKELAAALPQETDRAVKNAMRVALAVADLEDPQPRQGGEATKETLSRIQVDAAHYLAGSMHPQARSALTRIADNAERDGELQSAARSALQAIERRVSFYGWVETLFFGLSLGSVIVLAAMGLSITFGVMGVINMAHGELIMLGAYTTYSMQQLLPGQPTQAFLLSIPCAFLVAGGIGMAIERGVIRHLYGRPLETLLATFGISLILQQAVRSIYSPLNRSVATPEFLSGALQITEGLALTWVRLYIVVFALAVFASVLLFMKTTRMGLQIRAVAENRRMARAMGVRTGRVDALTFGIGSGIAGIAGVALALLTNVGPNMGQSYIIDSFLVVVSGGVGNLWGTLVAGLSIGTINKLLEPATGAVLAKVLVLVLVILFIQWRPHGLFPQRGRSAEP